MPKPKLAVACCVHDDATYLAESLRSFAAVGPRFAFVSRVPWNEFPGDWQAAAAAARTAGAEVVEGEWASELAHRQAVQAWLLERGYTHALIPDGDEVIEPALLAALTKVAAEGLADRVHVEWDTYWKSPEYVIRPRERFTPLLLVDLRAARPVGLRNFEGGRRLFLPGEHGIVHHLSYAGPDERIRRKISTWAHRDEVRPGWYEHVWLRWDADRLLRNFHPTHPEAYGFAERIAVPEPLRRVHHGDTETRSGAEEEARGQGGKEAAGSRRGPGQSEAGKKAEALPAVPAHLLHTVTDLRVVERSVNLPAQGVSVVIPVHGGREDLRACLESLERCGKLVSEVIVVDNASPDAAWEVAEWRTGVRVLRHKTNLGFAAACNHGLETARGELVLFLNSDTIVPRAGLEQLVAALRRSGSIAAAGPYTNECGHFQRLDPTYTSLSTLDLFAEDFAAREVEDVETDMLVGFCLLVRRGALAEVGVPGGPSGFDERFGLGTFEDNDLCYRLRRAGYRLVIAARSWVHHHGSRTLLRLEAGGSGESHAKTQSREEDAEGSEESHAKSQRRGEGAEGAGEPHAKTQRREENAKSGKGGEEGGAAGGGEVAAAGPPASGTEVPACTDQTRLRGLRPVSPRRRTSQVQAGTSVPDPGPDVPPAPAPLDIGQLLRRNEVLYRVKWHADLESGVASHLSGLAAARFVFTPERQPEALRRRVVELARRADISLTMIVRNEARVLRACLASAKPFFRELIVVDTGSTDETVAIAREFGARVFEIEWPESFAAARNEALRHALGKWVFWMDADDTLPWACGEALLQAALGAPPGVAGFIVPVQFVDDGTVAGGTRVDHVKLFRNLPGLTWEGRIHEQILSSLGKHGAVARSGALVLHSGYDGSPAGQAKKRERNMRLLKLDLEQRPDHPFVLFNMGMEEHYSGNHEEAVGWLKRSIDASGGDESHLRKAWALLALSLKALERDDDCRQALEHGLAAFPEDPELHFQAGLFHAAAGDLEAAKGHYLQAADRDIAGHYSSLDVGILGYKAYHNLAGVLWQLGDYRGAREWWEEAVEAAPEFLPSAFALFDAALETGDFAAGARMLDRVRQVEGPGESWAKMGLKHAEALGGPENGLLFLRRAVTQAPGAAAPRLLLGHRLLESGQEAEAAEHLRPLAEAGIPEAAYYLGVAATRRGDLRGALACMERARALNSGHEETAAQVANLRRALGLPEEEPETRGMPFEAVVEAVAGDLGLQKDDLLAYAREDMVGGYGAQGSRDRSQGTGVRRQESGVSGQESDRRRQPATPPLGARTEPAPASLHPAGREAPPPSGGARTEPGTASLNPASRDAMPPPRGEAGYPRSGSRGGQPWPGGSVWEDEGRLLYALVRALQPETIVEVGSKAGCSTSHLAAACAMNGKGKVIAVDPAADFSRLDPALLAHVEPVKKDVFAWQPPAGIDFLFEDGAHTPGFTGGVLERLRDHLSPAAMVLCHDPFQRDFGDRIWAEFQEAMGEGADRVLITPSDCGLAYARWQPQAEESELPRAA